MARKSRVSIGSTEPQSRKVLEGILKDRPKKRAKAGDTGNQTTAKNPPGVKRKTAEEGAKEKEKLRKKQEERIRKSNEASKKKKK